jgi:hypothetical protein
VLERAGLTAKQLDALKLYAGQRGYKSIALALDISRDAARDRIRGGLRALELAMVRRAERDHPPRMIRPGWDRRSGPWCARPERRDGLWPTASR